MDGNWKGRGLVTPTSLPKTEPDSPNQDHVSYVNHVLDRRADRGDAASARRRLPPTTQLTLAEDNDAVSKIISKGRSSALKDMFPGLIASLYIGWLRPSTEKE